MQPFELSRRGLSPFGLLREILSTARLYRRLRPDIVHHVALRPVVVGGLAARLVSIRSVVSAIAGMGSVYTGSRITVVRRVLGVLLRMALRRGIVVVQNPDDAAIVGGFGVGAERRRLIAGAGVDIDLYTPLPEPDGERIVLMVSRLLRDKGVVEFVEAARRLRGRARFVLVGTPDEGNPASVGQEEVEAWVGEGTVEWWGHQADMNAVYPRAHVVCLPSYREGLPKVLLEAMACGRPCITSDVPGCRDAVRHEENGLVVPARDAKALAEAIERLLEDGELRRRLGARGRQRAEREFSQQRVIEQTLAIYAELCPA